MIDGALIFASSEPADGRAVLALGAGMFVVSVTEAIVNRRLPTGSHSKISAWAGRCFAIAVWLLMIFAGIKILMR